MLQIGIDPGTANLGLAVVVDGEYVFGLHFAPQKKGLYEAANYALEIAEKHYTGGDKVLTIERYVSYKGIQTSGEGILMLIGALVYVFSNAGYKVLATRAIDWKPVICKHLFKTTGFRNPSKEFDKVYSLAAAKELTGKELKNNHVADAICLAYSSGLQDLKHQLLHQGKTTNG